jgi:hypothetical protein
MACFDMVYPGFELQIERFILLEVNGDLLLPINRTLIDKNSSASLLEQLVNAEPFNFLLHIGKTLQGG